MFTRQYYNQIHNTPSSRLNPIDSLMKDILLNIRPTNDIFSKTNISKDFSISSKNSNLSRTDSGYKYKTIATGLTQEDLEIYIEDSSLVILTKKSDEDNEFPDPFKINIDHKIKLKDKVDKDNIVAHLSNGVLEITIPFDDTEEVKRTVKFI
tara:strand:- start:92 stop:547 length:456 start_codon:yes stop_codon:yes gene_type:complete